MIGTFKCSHTGLPKAMCGHCNGTRALEVEAFRGRAVDETPRFVKGRDKAEWQGIGQNLDHSGSAMAQRAALESFHKPKGVSPWVLAQSLKTLTAVVNKIDTVPAPAMVEVAKKLTPIVAGVPVETKWRAANRRTHLVRGDDVVEAMDCDIRKSPAKNTKPPVPNGHTDSPGHRYDFENRALLRHAKTPRKQAKG